ncbi:MAG: hypothetical protein Q7J67_08985 [bacterium]|nr:hypothetical protein [bacterium]
MNEKASGRIETILIFLAIFSVWPTVFRINNIYSKIGMYVFLIIMLIVFFKRIKRIRTYMRDYSDFKKKKVIHSEKSD